MKKLAVKTAVAILAIFIMSLVGCKTIVTDVNAELDAINPKEDLGIPVKYNENYIEVAYNPANASKPAEETAEDNEKNEDKTDLSEDKRNDETEVLSETLENNEADTDKEDAGSEEDDADNEEDGNTEDGEDGTQGSEEDAENDNEAEEDTEDDNEESDLNASMAEENFDAEFYAATYPDVVAVFGNSPEALYKHYLDYGKAEGRSCNAEEFALLNESTN